MPRRELVSAARKLGEIIENLDRSHPLLDQAYAILRPLLDDVVAGKITSSGQLSHRTFFFGMYEDSLPAHYLNDVDFMNALADFDKAWQWYEP